MSTELDDPVVVAFPLRGPWVAMTTPAHRIPSHGTDVLGQRYAFDFVRTDARRGVHLHPAGTLRSLVIGGRTRDCYGWGQPVHAAFDGEVVAAMDGIPERAWLHVVRELALVLKNAVTYDPKRGFGPLAGNHVIMRNGNAFAAYARLTTGSVAVEAGQDVRTGEPIGRVGHSGNSTAPHLHFQLMDSADPVHAKGIPCAFAEYLAESDGRWCGSIEACPAGTSGSARSSSGSGRSSPRRTGKPPSTRHPASTRDRASGYGSERPQGEVAA